jgi:medium-chain acyl-[acyl-carrier-protein] hydrolase
MQRRYNGIPAAVLESAELLELFLPTIRADVTLADTYEHTIESPLDLPLTALGGMKDSRATTVELAAWKQHTNRAFTSWLFPGGHFYLHDAREALIQTIVTSLEAAGARVDERPNLQTQSTLDNAAK